MLVLEQQPGFQKKHIQKTQIKNTRDLITLFGLLCLLLIPDVKVAVVQFYYSSLEFT
jgi:hypothetical protein